MSNMSLQARVFYAIRLHDIELAETFAMRCPSLRDIVDLNTFFHQVLSQYPEDTRGLRQCLDDTMDMETWLRYFTADILPFLRRHRFPPTTHRHAKSFYAATNDNVGILERS